MSIVTTLLLNKRITLPQGTCRKIGIHEHAEVGNAAKGKRTRTQILALSDQYTELTAKIVAHELGITQVCALSHLHKLADSGDLTKVVIKRLVSFTKPTHQQEAA